MRFDQILAASLDDDFDDLVLGITLQLLDLLARSGIELLDHREQAIEHAVARAIEGFGCASGGADQYVVKAAGKRGRPGHSEEVTGVGRLGGAEVWVLALPDLHAGLDRFACASRFG